MSQLFIVRHCESKANIQHILASQIDYPLSEKGMQDAKAIATDFAKEHAIDLVISSPLTRARQTAQPFVDLFGVEIITDERLLEQHLGQYSGMTYEQVENEPGYQHEKEKRWNWVPAGEGGESYSQITDRINDFFENLEVLRSDKNILIVSHAVTMRLIKMVLDQTTPIYPTTLAKNGEIWEYEFPIR